jgi:phosphate transport system substrate-binding protein
MARTLLVHTDNAMHHVNAMLRRAVRQRGPGWALLLLLFPALPAQAREQVRVVGSSTLFPFASVVAENFARNSRWKSPVVESTGTGGGFKLFCRGAGPDTPDITDASRPMSDGERQECVRNRVGRVIGIRVGSDGIIIASSAGTAPLHLTREQLYRATAKTVAIADRLIANPYRRWVDIDPGLPNRPIIVYGPAPNHGTRDAFAALAMTPPCERLAPIRKMSRQEQQQACQSVREDGAWIDVAGDYRSLLARLSNDQNAVAVLTFSYLNQNRNVIQAASIDAIEPSFESIGAWTYPLSRPLFLYVKQAHVGLIPGLAEYVQEFTSERAAGAHGYLVDQGLGPLPPGFLRAERAKAMALGDGR